MFEYIEGTIKDIESTYIVLDNNGIGYLINVASPYSFSIDEKDKVYVYQHIREDENTLYGFKNKEEKELFLKLIDVKGLGPKMALPFFATGSTDGIKDAIERENILYLKKFPKIGDKVARQIILDLKGKLNTAQVASVKANEELEDALKGLGYKKSDIDKIMPSINQNDSIEIQIKEALKLLLK